MVYLAIFALAAALEIVSALLVFSLKDVLHSVLALSVAFFVNSLLFLMLAQPLLALLNLFIMVGGVSTYIFVGVASLSYSKFKHTSHIALGVLSLLLFAALFYPVYQSSPNGSEQNLLTAQMIGSSLTTNIGVLYIVTLVLFGIGLSSILVLRKVGSVK